MFVLSRKPWILPLLIFLVVHPTADAQLVDPKNPGEKRFVVALANAPWSKVLAWVSEMSGLPVAARQLPTGNFNLITPDKRQFTLAEIIDVVNDGLQATGYLLVRQQGSILVVAAEDRLPPNLIPVVQLKDLPLRGRSELVRVVVPVRNVDQRDPVPGIKRLLGPHGDAALLGNQLVLTDTAGNLTHILPLVMEQPPEAVTEVLPLHQGDPVQLTKLLRGMFSGQDKTGALYIDFDSTRHTLVVRGSRPLIAEVKAALLVLEKGAGSTGDVRIIHLDKGSSATMAESLQELLGKLRNNPVQVIVPGTEPTKEPAKNPGKKDSDKPGQKPISITPVGQRVIIVSDDAEALTLVQDLARMLQAAPVSEDLTVLRLQHVPAPTAAKVLDELFNGPAQPRPQPERLRVVADPHTNSLLVRASPLDLLTIRNLLKTQLDQKGTK